LQLGLEFNGFSMPRGKDRIPHFAAKDKKHNELVHRNCQPIFGFSGIPRDKDSLPACGPPLLLGTTREIENGAPPREHLPLQPHLSGLHFAAAPR
jgi:hypothetical protein